MPEYRGGVAGCGTDAGNRLPCGLHGLEVGDAEAVCLMPGQDLPNTMTDMETRHIKDERISLIADRRAATLA